MTCSETGGYTARFRNKTAIDLTPFTTFYITCKTGYTDSRVGIMKTYSGTSDWRVYATTTSTSTKTYSMDVSSFENLKGVICVGQPNGNMSLSAAWFE